MATCQHCKHDVITVTYGPTTLLLDPHLTAYAAVEEHHQWPEDGDRVFLTTGLVEHSAVCPQQRGERERAQAAYRAKHPAKDARA
jgi:hypothetical protein